MRAQRLIALCAVLTFSVLAALGAWRAYDAVWTSVGQQRLGYRTLSAEGRNDAAALGVTDLRAFTFWAAHVHRGDRYYLNAQPASMATVIEVAGYYLVPAEPELDPKRATVILSFDRPPADAGVRLSSTLQVPGTGSTFSRVAQ